MKYRLKIYGITGTGTPITTLTTPDFTVRGWAKAVNGARNMSFSLPKSSAKATSTILQKQRQVTLLRKKEDGTDEFYPEWHGFIRAEQEIGDEKVVECVGLLNILAKRETLEDESFTGQGSQEVFGLIADTNERDGDTGIVEGIGGVTTTRDIQASGFETVLSMIDRLAEAHGAEYEIDETRAMNFVPSLGTDKSETVEIIFRRDGTPGNNVDQMQIGDDAEKMYTRVIGYTSSGLEYQYDNEDAQETYGVLVLRKRFDEANDLETLTAMTTVYGIQVSTPLTDFQAVPTMARKKYLAATGVRRVVGLKYDDVRAGDLVTVTIVTGNQSMSTVKRIAELSVSVSASGKETLSFTFSEEGVFTTAASLDAAESSDIARRLAQLEQGSGSSGGGVTDHGELTGLGDDDHTQYHNDARGDARYSSLGHNHSGVYEPANPNIQSHISNTSNPHSVTKTQVGLGNVDNTADADKPISTATQAALDDKADLVDGVVPASQLPSYVDDVLEYADAASFPETGETAKIYVALDTNLAYRWSGTVYVEISPSLALGETSSTAYRGDRGKTAYDHSQVTSGNPHSVSKSDVGLGNVTNDAQVKKAASSTDGKLPKWSGVGGDTIVDGYAVVTSVGDPGTDTNIPTEKAVRDAVAAGGGGGLTQAQALILISLRA